jgi:cytosine/adenosine deaminase-related metal-dependent hydrolase
MSETQIFSDYGLIGENLEIKKNIIVEISEVGKIKKLFYKNIGKSVNITENKPTYLLMPGLINSHIHIGDSFAKEEGFNKNLIEVVAPPDGLKHRLLKSVPENVIVNAIYETSMEMISNGTTFFIDFRENELDGIFLLKKALKGSPINYLILGRFRNIDQAELVYDAADGFGFASYKHINSRIKDKLKELKRNTNKNFACHDAENVRDEIIFEEILADNLIDVIIHGTQYIKEDLIKIKKKKIGLVLCPRSNGYFGVGFPPINEILKLRIPVSLGTDNVMVNNVDLFEEMRYLYRFARVLLHDKNKNSIKARDLLKMVTINAARNFGLENKIGAISEGKFADFFMIDLNAPNFYSYKAKPENIYPLIVHRTKSQNIKWVYIRGEKVYERT